MITIINPDKFPDKSVVAEYLEPTVLGTIIAPDEYIGKIISLCQVSEIFLSLGLLSAFRVEMK